MSTFSWLNHLSVEIGCHAHSVYPTVMLVEFSIFRNKDFTNNQFVIARDMLISEDETQIVGFLCESINASKFLNNEWVCAEGNIYVGNYYGPMPIIRLTKINSISKPNSPFVLPPKDF